VKSIGRHVDAGLIPGHSQKQLEAIETLEQTAQRLALHMVLKVGDLQFVADSEYIPPRLVQDLGRKLMLASLQRMCSTLELPTPTTRHLRHGVTFCDCGWPPRRAREGGSVRSRTAHTRSGVGYRSMTRKRLARWMRSETCHEARHGYQTTMTFYVA
jgi:hypothetical protein